MKYRTPAAIAWETLPQGDGIVALPAAFANWSDYRVQFIVDNLPEREKGEILWTVLPQSPESQTKAQIEQALVHKTDWLVYLTGPFFRAQSHIFRLQAQALRYADDGTPIQFSCDTPWLSLQVQPPCPAPDRSCEGLPGGPDLQCEESIPACIYPVKQDVCDLPRPRPYFWLETANLKLEEFAATVVTSSRCEGDCGFRFGVQAPQSGYRLRLQPDGAEQPRNLDYHLLDDSPLPLQAGDHGRFVFGSWDSSDLQRGDGDGYLMIFDDTAILLFLGEAGSSPPHLFFDRCNEYGICPALEWLAVASSCGPRQRLDCGPRPAVMLVAADQAAPQVVFAGHPQTIGSQPGYELQLGESWQILCPESSAAFAPAANQPMAWNSFILQRRANAAATAP